MPGRGRPGTAGSTTGLPGLLHASHLSGHAGLLPLPLEQGKEGPTWLSSTQVLPILGPWVHLTTRDCLSLELGRNRFWS